jgi:hypothetical protein
VARVFALGAVPAIDCGERCSAVLDAGTSVLLTASPVVQPPHRFVRWEGCDSITVSPPYELVCVVRVTVDRTVHAVFE